ncbi:hypothetical protein DMUE_6039 [Dictyocoela muelleri]|nr:hypothetical protein DMUE_6039 [Dictyocoela muelleri]
MFFDKISKTIKKHPESIIIDFESAAFISLKKNFPSSKISGCFFHFSQIIWRRVQKESMTIIYRNESNFRACVKMILAFSFLPKTKIPSMIYSFESYISIF